MHAAVAHTGRGGGCCVWRRWLCVAEDVVRGALQCGRGRPPVRMYSMHSDIDMHANEARGMLP
eukprot:365707-Chlamydomonas_euryale.AAC.27